MSEPASTAQIVNTSEALALLEDSLIYLVMIIQNI